MNYNKLFSWDNKSDQPYQIKDQKFKNRMRLKNIGDIVGYIIPILILYPISIVFSYFIKDKQTKSIEDFCAMSVNLDKGEEQLNLIKELGIKKVLIRFFLSDMSSIDKYVAFAKTFEDSSINILINIVQTREHIDNNKLLEDDINIVFQKFYFIKEYQIGSTINRSKWGFFAVSEYLRFYKIVQNIRDKKFRDILLIGPSVIDFEYHYTLRALFNFSKVRYDKLSSLLYVDRRGAPENTQTIFNFRDKIRLLFSISKLSYMSRDKIVITETNWPLSNTAPYAPTSESECVDESTYASFMLRYYLLGYSTGLIESIYWHQLIARGYGLIDEIDGVLRKRDAFYVYKNMLQILNGAIFISFIEIDNYYEMRFKNRSRVIKIVWFNDGSMQIDNIFDEVFDIKGDKIEQDLLLISSSPIYLLHTI